MKNPKIAIKKKLAGKRKSKFIEKEWIWSGKIEKSKYREKPVIKIKKSKKERNNFPIREWKQSWKENDFRKYLSTT